MTSLPVNELVDMFTQTQQTGAPTNRSNCLDQSIAASPSANRSNMAEKAAAYAVVASFGFGTLADGGPDSSKGGSKSSSSVCWPYRAYANQWTFTDDAL
jgi:hypothetical protein